MSHAFAERLLAHAGPGRLLHYGCRDSATVSALLQRGCDAWGIITDPRLHIHDHGGRLVREAEADAASLPVFDTVVVTGNYSASVDETTALLRSLRSRTGRNLILCLEDSAIPPLMQEVRAILDNRQLEEAALAAGYRRHPAGFPIARYQRLNDPSPEALLFFEIISDAVLARWPLEFLLANRDLHMDMSRETGPRSDAHLVRYALAAEWIRPGDTVLDCACGLGYGSALLAAASRGSRFIGVDIDSESVAYARDNFVDYPVEYRATLATRLDFLPDRSVDMVVSFETIEHVEDYGRFLDEIARVLKPDGRMICSVPNLWVDESGQDPNPHHHHAFDYARIRDALSCHFIVEARYGQTAPGGFKLLDTLRQIDQRPLDTDASEADTEWWIVVATANPAQAAAGYRHPEFDPCTAGTRAQLTAFASHYDNPWIYRQLIQNGQRIRDPDVLAATIESVAAQTDANSADFGAMLAVRAYEALRHGERDRTELTASIETYLALPSDNPHIRRWQISLCYVAALLALDSGHRNHGKALLEQVAGLDPFCFSPLLSTKTVAAHFLLGIIRLVDREADLARASFVAGIEAARRALHAPDENVIGRPDRPLSFGFFELAEIADMAGQCAMAIQSMDQFLHAPGQFWRCVDAKRFGLFTWIKNQEVEQARLRTEVERLRREATLRILVPMRIREIFSEILPALIARALRKLISGISSSRHSDGGNR